jgi:hypothetical protein
MFGQLSHEVAHLGEPGTQHKKGATTMWLFTFTAARTALTYITVGALTVIWAGVWHVYLYNNPPAAESTYYWCSGFLVTGLTLAVIGLVLSLINRSAQQADAAALSVPAAAVSVQSSAATAPSPVPAPLGLPSPVAAPNVQLVVAPPDEPFAEIAWKHRQAGRR